MALEARLLTGLTLAVAVVYWTTPLAIRLADRFEFYDRPVGYKGHVAPTPYLGGAAVVGGFVLTLLVLTGDWSRTLPLVGGMALLWVVGTIDDRRHLSPTLRIAVELGLAVLLWQLGLGWELGAGAGVDLVVTAVWIVAVVNAFNLFDNMDGAASSMAGVAAIGLALVGIVEADAWLAVAGAALAGACLGFLPHNLFSSPARIFLGDGGSMPIGFAIAALAMIGLTGAAPAWQSLGMGLLFVGIPALDTALVVVSRRRRGISLLTGGRDHLTHRTQQRLRTARSVALTLGAAQALVSALAVVALQGGSVAIVLAVAVYVVGLGVAITLLDTRLAPEPAASGPSAPPPAPAPALPPRRGGIEMVAPLLLVPLGLAGALSPFASAYYAPSAWVPLGLALVAVTAALAIGRPAPLTRPALLAIASLGALAVWSLASSTWADSAQQAIVEANRMLVYAVALGALLLLVRSERAAHWLIGAIAAGGIGVAAFVVVRMLGSGSPDLFLNGRLHQPLGYINGQASFFLLAFWACLAVAEHRRRPLLAGAGAAAATLLASLLVLSQSRGVALAAVGSALIVVAVVPHRVARAWCLLLIAAAVGAAAPALLEVFSSAAGAAPPAGVAQSAAVAALVAALVAGVVWGVVARVSHGAGSSSFRRAPAVALAGVLAVGLVATAANAPRIADAVDRQYRAFVQLDRTPDPAAEQGASRLVSGGGNRYDYWRVAWEAFEERPLLGLGAGNYDDPYFARRSTAEDIRQPHSIQLQALSELGLVGLALLALLLVAAAWGTARAVHGRLRHATTAPAVAGVGTVTAWAVHSSVDWIHLLPGVTLMALVGLALLVAPGREPAARERPAAADWRPNAFAAVTVAVVLAVAALSLTRQGMTEYFQGQAEDALAADPARALQEANRALRLDPNLIGAYYVKAAAFARFNEAAAARAALEEAARREPRDFVTWALLGDLSVRMGKLDRARREYARASALNPRDPSLAASARDPDRRLGGAGG